MKKIIILVTILGLSLVNVSASDTKVNNNDRLCKIFTQKVSKYSQNMRTDEYAIKTLESYKKRAKDFCSK
jgi:dUTPase